MSFMKTEPILSGPAHSSLFEGDPDAAFLIGVGYNSAQRQVMIYRHLKKLRDSLHGITGGDALKAKALSEMLYLRSHAGKWSLAA